ncbi:E4 ORFE [Bovine mastadenovirus A]|uniref:E4 ORFE n=1 Tax=Bovine mastadenovirus A TaxID=129953 RepID=UPI0000443F9D|nr:E4 ORFE [Bovine mastadenovirus A]
MTAESTRSKFQHKIISYVDSPQSALPLAMNLEIPIPWKSILVSWQYRLLKDYLCLGTRLKVECGGDIELMFKRNKGFKWSVCCHDLHEGSTLEALSRRRFITDIVKELVGGTEYNIRFPFYRPLTNKDLSFRLLYEGSIMFRGLHLIFIKINYWGDVPRIRNLRFEGAVFCIGYTGVYLVIICRHCHEMTQVAALACAERTRTVLLLAGSACNILSLPPSEYERNKQRLIKRLTRKSHLCCRCS